MHGLGSVIFVLHIGLFVREEILFDSSAINTCLANHFTKVGTLREMSVLRIGNSFHPPFCIALFQPQMIDDMNSPIFSCCTFLAHGVSRDQMSIVLLQSLCTLCTRCDDELLEERSSFTCVV